MKKARIIIGANYGDEGKGTVVARYTKNNPGNVLNVLTNGGAQRGHSILTEDGNITSQHFGSGTYYGADNYYSRFFILNPMQFVKEYESLIVKPKHIYRDRQCIWTTPYDSLANLISEKLQNRQASCGMGIWNTIRRSRTFINVSFDGFNILDANFKSRYLDAIKEFYEKELIISDNTLKSVWDSEYLKTHFIEDCEFMYEHTIGVDSMPKAIIGSSFGDYDEFIFENGQGLLLCDTGLDTPDTTPSNTGIQDALDILNESAGKFDITAHYVTRPYLTRHGFGELTNEKNRSFISNSVQEDRTNHYNEFQGEFRFGELDIEALQSRIWKDAGEYNIELEVTHCDEMDRVSEFKKMFDKVNTYDSPLV